MEEIEFSRWLFEGRLRQGKNVLPDGLNWLCYFAGCSKSHREDSISFIFLESSHQVEMKNVVKFWKDFLSYFTTLETYRVHGLRTPNEAFFIEIPKLLGLGKQIGQINFGALGIFLVKLSATILIL
jgi:hypothetical protein